MRESSSSVGSVEMQKSNEGKRPRVTAELIKSREVLDIPVQGNFQPLLDSINRDLGTEMKPRSEGFHVTLFDIEETRAVGEKLTPLVLKILNDLNDVTEKGAGIHVVGIGYVDGRTSQYNLRDVDRAKRVVYIKLDCPRLDWVRRELGLDYTDENGVEHKKDFRLTLGYEVGDIRKQVVGHDQETGKRIMEPIPRDLDTIFGLQDKFGKDLDKVLNIKFGEIGGPDKKERHGGK
ncbi:MAG: hypothetical protein HY225_04255 [Candidatus Vogelbacteria bacterium]|nr:hypothetical protein [Candidatus Vogelbacteria bacterium]